MVVIVLGIGGVSRSGKSSLTKRICEEFSIPTNNVFNVDDYLISPIITFDPKINETINDWDHKDAYDTTKMEIEALNRIEFLRKDTSIDKTEIVILEGWLLFSLENLISSCDLKFMIQIDQEEAFNRRISSKKIGNKPELFRFYFDEYLWKRFTEYK